MWIQKKLDKKADKDDMDGKHQDNIERLDKLIDTIEKMDEKMEKMGNTVAILGDRAGLGGKYP